MKRFREEILCLLCIVVAVVSLQWSVEVMEDPIERVLKFGPEQIRELEVTFEDTQLTESWIRPGVGWLEAEGRNEHVFRVLWELSRLKVDDTSSPATVVRTIRLATPQGDRTIRLGRLRAGFSVPVEVDGAWYRAPGEIWEALENLLLAARQ